MRTKRIEIDSGEFKFWVSKGWSNRRGEQLDPTKPYILVDEYGEEIVQEGGVPTPEWTCAGSEDTEEDVGYGSEQRARITQMIEDAGIDEKKMHKDIAKRNAKEEARRAKLKAKQEAQDAATEEDSLSTIQQRLRDEAMRACRPVGDASSDDDSQSIKEETQAVLKGPRPAEEGVEQQPWGQRQYRGKTVSEKNMQKIYDAIDELPHVVGKYPSVRQLLARKGWTLRYVAVLAGVSRTTVTRWRDQDAHLPKANQIHAYYNYTKRNPKAAIDSLMRD